jgi:hypothetical protein
VVAEWVHDGLVSSAAAAAAAKPSEQHGLHHRLVPRGAQHRDGL